MALTPEVGVNFKVTGTEQVNRQLKLVRDQAEPTGRQWGSASRTIAGGLEQIARTGKVTGESLKQVVAQGAEMAFMFGAAGPIVGAIGILGVAIYEHVTGNMKEAEEQAKKTADAIRAMVDAGDKAGIYKQMSTVWRGTPSQNFADGIVGLNARRDQIRRERDLWTPDKGLPKWRELAAALDDVNARLAKQNQLFAQLRDAYNAPMPYAGTGQLAGMSTEATAGGGGPLLQTNRSASNQPYALPGLSLMGIGKPAGGAISVKGIGLPQPELTAAERELQKAAEQIGATFAETLANAIGDGVRSAFENGFNLASIGGAIVKSAAASLGGIAVQIGKQALAVALAQQKVIQAIASWGPAGVAAALGLIALGSVMQSAGGGRGGASGGGGYGGGSYSAASGYGASIIDRGIIDPTASANITARNPVNLNVMLIGRDPVVMRQLQELVADAQRRGNA